MKLWDETTNFWILNEEEFSKIPDGHSLVTINGEEVIKGEYVPSIHLEFGYTNCGVINPFEHKLKEYFFIFMLKR
jgi:hypothetical protein